MSANALLWLTEVNKLVDHKDATASCLTGMARSAYRVFNALSAHPKKTRRTALRLLKKIRGVLERRKNREEAHEVVKISVDFVRLEVWKKE